MIYFFLFTICIATIDLSLRRSVESSVRFSAISVAVYPDTELVEVEGSHTFTSCTLFNTSALSPRASRTAIRHSISNLRKVVYATLYIKVKVFAISPKNSVLIFAAIVCIRSCVPYCFFSQQNGFIIFQ